MLQFLSAIWFWASVAIIAPVIIHLWNNRHGKKIKIGSVLFLEENPVQRSKRNFISQWLLLFLRCLLIILAVLLLAQPIFKRDKKAGNEKGWILIDTRYASSAYQHFKTSIDSLLQKGFELHAFNKEFEKLPLENILTKKFDSVEEQTVQYRRLFKMLDETAPSGMPLVIFSTNELANFRNEIRSTTRTVNWYAFAKPDSIHSSIQQAYLSSSDSIQITKAISQPSGTRFVHEQLANIPEKKAVYTLGAENGRVVVSLQNDSNNFIVDTASFKITIYASNHFLNDASYLKAAIAAIQRFTKRKILLTIATTSNTIPEKQDWVFWLAEENVPSDVFCKNVFVYDNGSPVSINSWMRTAAQNNVEERIALAKYTNSNLQSVATETIWKTGNGKPLLAEEKASDKITYHFYSRFDPSWNGLVWDNSFPSLLMNLFFDGGEKRENDMRAIDEQQIQPKVEKISASNVPTKIFSETMKLDDIFWFLVLFIFLIERLVSFQNKKAAKNA